MKVTVVLVSLVALSLAQLTAGEPSATAAPSLKRRAEAFKRFLPRPPVGWSKVEEEVIAQDSAVSGSELSVRRRYRKGKAAEEIVEIHIGIKPNGKPLYLASLIDDPAKAAKDRLNGVPYRVAPELGQLALTRTVVNSSRQRREHRVVHALPNNVSVSYWVWTLPLAAAQPFRQAINYDRLGRLKP